MIKATLVAFATAGAALALYLYAHLGLGSPVDVAFEDLGPFHLVFLEHLGPYHGIGPAIDEVERWAKGSHQRCDRTFGEFLDDPGAVDEDRLRSRAGCVMDDPPIGAPARFKTETRARRRYAVGRFAGSPAVGPYKVYPKIEAFVREHRLKAAGRPFELYRRLASDGPGGIEVLYLFSLEP